MTLTTASRPIGWQKVDDGTDDEQYWDGRVWTLRRRRHEDRWLFVPVDRLVR